MSYSLSFPAYVGVHPDAFPEGRKSRKPVLTSFVSGASLQELARNAAKLLNEPGQSEIRYGITWDDRDQTTNARLQVLGPVKYVEVGPLGGARLPEDGPISPEKTYASVDELAANLDLVDRPGTYVVTVKRNTSYWSDTPDRRRGESTPAFRKRLRAFLRRAKAKALRAEGWYAATAAGDPVTWTGETLVDLAKQLYRLLPAATTRFPGYVSLDSGSYNRGPESNRAARQFILKVTRGDYNATLRLPQLPARALAEFIYSEASKSAEFKWFLPTNFGAGTARPDRLIAAGA